MLPPPPFNMLPPPFNMLPPLLICFALLLYCLYFCVVERKKETATDMSGGQKKKIGKLFSMQCYN